MIRNRKYRIWISVLLTIMLTDCFGQIQSKEGKSGLVNKKKILDVRDLTFKCNLETQNFRPPDEKGMIFSAHKYQDTDVMELDIETGKVVNYSKAPDQYDEPEGIFPDGKYTLAECDKHIRKEIHYNDIYKPALNGSGHTERPTFFSNYLVYKSTNPVVSNDGRYMAFQFAKRGDLAGVGRGILIFDLEMYEKIKKSEDK